MTAAASHELPVAAVPAAPAGAPGVSVRLGAPSGDAALVGDAHEGASRTDRLMAWDPIIRPANAEVVPEKARMDARSRDIARNDGAVAGVIRLTKDTIAGQQYLLNAKPDSLVLFGKKDEDWEGAFQAEVETKFTLWAESPSHWADASRQNTLTGLVRLGLGSFALGGEVLAAAQWMADDGRPFRSSMLLLDPDRLSNPNHNAYAPNIVGGVERDRFGAPVAYHILDRHPNDFMGSLGVPHWRRVMARKPNWGRPNILHIFEQDRPDQARGVSSLVSALVEMKMLKEFRKVDLQRAVVAATYAATLESDLPGGDLWTMMGGGTDGVNPATEYTASYMDMMATYLEAAKALRMDGAKIPALPVGTKLKIQAPGAASPIGADFETSMQRYIAAALGVSYEEYSRDFTKTNYSSGRSAQGVTDRRWAAMKKIVADAIASFLYRLWFEEAINVGALDTMKGRRMPSFYEGLNSEAYCACQWIGAGRGQVDEMKETQAAALRMRTGMTTLEDEVARLGGDWRKTIAQIAREEAAREAAGLPKLMEMEPTPAENAASGEPREVAE